MSHGDAAVQRWRPEPDTSSRRVRLFSLTPVPSADGRTQDFS